MRFATAFTLVVLFGTCTGVLGSADEELLSLVEENASDDLDSDFVDYLENEFDSALPSSDEAEDVSATLYYAPSLHRIPFWPGGLQGHFFKRACPSLPFSVRKAFKHQL